MFWLALAVCLVAVLGSIGYAAIRAWRLWKTARAAARAANQAVGRVMSSAAAAEKRAVSLTAGTERLSGAITHLQALARRARRDPRRRRRAARPPQVDPRPGAAEVTRVAAIDLGTNATRLLVADVTDGGMTEIVRRTRITRLGEGVDARRRLLPVPIARVRNALTDFRREADELGAERTLAVATSAVRDAENGEAFLGEVEWSYGFATRLLSGDEEAAMTLSGVGPLAPGTVVVDVGGGSTELITDRFRTSLDLGCVRLTERSRHRSRRDGGRGPLDACRRCVPSGR